MNLDLEHDAYSTLADADTYSHLGISTETVRFVYDEDHAEDLRDFSKATFEHRWCSPRHGIGTDLRANSGFPGLRFKPIYTIHDEQGMLFAANYSVDSPLVISWWRGHDPMYKSLPLHQSYNP